MKNRFKHIGYHQPKPPKQSLLVPILIFIGIVSAFVWLVYTIVDK